MTDLSQSPAWMALKAHFEDIKNTHMRDLIQGKPQSL